MALSSIAAGTPWHGEDSASKGEDIHCARGFVMANVSAFIGTSSVCAMD